MLSDVFGNPSLSQNGCGFNVNQVRDGSFARIREGTSGFRAAGAVVHKKVRQY